VSAVADMRSHGLERASMAEIYEVFSAQREARRLVVRTSADPVQLAPTIRSTLRSLDKSVIAFRYTTMQDVLREQTAARRFEGVLNGTISAACAGCSRGRCVRVMHYFVTSVFLRSACGWLWRLWQRYCFTVSCTTMRFAGAGLAVG